MPPLSLTAIAAAALAFVGLAFNLPDRWFSALLALACLLGSADAAWHGRTLWTLLLLVLGALFAGASVHAAYSTGREQRRQQ